MKDIVEGIRTELEDRTKTEWKDWDEKDTRAQVLLLTTITQEQYLVNCETAATMWSKLKSIHEQKTEISREHLWQRFYD